VLIRKHFITNSSSTGFVAWGAVIPKKYFETLPDFSEEKDSYTKDIAVLYVSDTERAVCLVKSLTRLNSYGTEDDGCIDEGVYQLRPVGRYWQAKCTATIDFTVDEPSKQDYTKWYATIDKFLLEQGIEPRTYVCQWMHVRSYG
jgi:hypothetical protein